MLGLPITNSWGFIYTNQDNGSHTPGTSVTPGASDAEGAFAEIAPDASITTNIYYMTLRVTCGGSTGQAKNHLLDVYYDPTGGTTYNRSVFDNFACGAAGLAGSIANMGDALIRVPCNIPAGSAIAARVQGSNGTAGTVRVLLHAYGKPSRPELWRPAAYSETLGYTSGTLGTTFTPGNAGWGTWVSLGTTTKKHFWAQLGVQINNATKNSEVTHVQLAIGDGTNQHIIGDILMVSSTAENTGRYPHEPCTWEIPAGAELWVRGNCSAAPASGYNATAVLFGG